MNEMSSALGTDALGGVTLATDGGLLRFSAGGVRFCVDLEQVGQVLFLPALQAVPGGPPYLVGFMELGRHSLPVIDLARRLGLAGAEYYGVNTPILLCRHGDRRFGLIVLDAFSSDSIPVHLLTVEAMTLYMSKLDDTGLLAFHVSNRNMILQPVVAAAARDLGLEAYYRHHPPVKGDPLKYGSEVVVVGRKGGAVDTFADRSEWRHLSATVTARAWTDDYSNVLGAVLAQLRAAKPDSL